MKEDLEPTPVSMMVIKNRIRDFRRDFELTQEQLADAVGVSRQSIISVESGRCLPSVPLAWAISRYFNHPIDQVFFIEPTNEEATMANDRGLSPFRHNFDRMIEEAIMPFGRGFGAVNTPQMNIYQHDSAIVVEADVPGMTEDDIDIEISDGVLTIKGERKEESEGKNKEYFHREVSYGSFQRAVTLPADVEVDKAEATVKHGQLRVVLPKIVAEQPKVHKVKARKAE